MMNYLLKISGIIVGLALSVSSLFFSKVVANDLTVSSAQAAPALIDKISQQCPGLTSDAIRYGLTAYHTAKTHYALDNKNILTIVDFTQPSDDKRLCSIDLSDHAPDVIFNELVSHGKNSGARTANSFGNGLNSNKSSLGLFVTGTPYYGKAGYSLKLYGLDKGLNDNAAARHVVLHGTPHVSDNIAKKRGSIGHSLGCFAISKEDAARVIDQLKEGTLLFAYYPSADLKQKSVYLQPLQNNQDSLTNSLNT